jgi:hypothetical protein
MTSACFRINIAKRNFNKVRYIPIPIQNGLDQGDALAPLFFFFQFFYRILMSLQMDMKT